MKPRIAPLAFLLTLALAGLGCDGNESDANNVGPWLGNWLLVNFLTDDDDGVWEEDEPSGIGLVSSVTEDEWVLSDDNGGPCSVAFSYSVDRDRRYSRRVTGKTGGCDPDSFPVGMTERGRLEFSEDEDYMFEYFAEGGSLLAFKWQRD